MSSNSVAADLEVGTWQHDFARQPFRSKLRWLRNLAVVALGVTLSANVLFGVINGHRLDTIEQGHYPLMQTAAALETTLSLLQRELQDAAAAADTTKLAGADSLSRVFAAHL